MIDPQFRYYTVGAKNVFNKAQVARDSRNGYILWIGCKFVK